MQVLGPFYIFPLAIANTDRKSVVLAIARSFAIANTTLFRSVLAIATGISSEQPMNTKRMGQIRSRLRFLDLLKPYVESMCYALAAGQPASRISICSSCYC